MANNTAPQVPEVLDAILKEAARIEEDTLYSSKSQFETARDLEWLHLLLGIPATLAAALSGVTYVADCKAWAIVLSIATAILTALLTFLDPNARARRHRDVGNSYKSLSNDARIFREIICRQKPNGSELGKAIQKLNTRRNRLNAKSPSHTTTAFNRARKGIEEGEATYAVDVSKQQGPPPPPAAPTA